jgi:acetolactate synthase I/II/III large subunit
MIPLRSKINGLMPQSAARFSAAAAAAAAALSGPRAMLQRQSEDIHRDHPIAYPSSPVTNTPPIKRPVEIEQVDEKMRFVGMTGAQIVHEILREQGVEVVFGYPGGAILPVYDAIYASPHFKFILPRREDGGGHMAEGYARVTGKPGVAIVTSGPGATNMITPLADALMDGTPLVVLTGQVATTHIGTDAFQEADVVGLARSVTKWCTLVKDVRDLPRAINEAFAIAKSGRPGPVLVDLPKDVTASILRERTCAKPRILDMINEKSALQRHKFGLKADQRDRIVKMINEAERPIIYCGQGVVSANAVNELRELAQKGDIPVTTTLMSMGAFDETDPRSLHMLGMHGSAYANYAMQAADVIVAVGARFDDRITGNVKKFAPGAYAAAASGKGGIVHFEISPKNINKVVQVHESVLGDVKGNLQELLPHVKSSPRKLWWKQLAAWKAQHPFTYPPAVKGGSIKPQRIIEEVYKQLQAAGKVPETIITTGVGQHQMWAAQYYRWQVPRSLITSGGAGTMGFGLPAAIGAKLAAPNHTVIDVDGDGSFLMTGLELITAVQYKIGVKVLLLNNNFQGMVRQWQDLFYNSRYSGTEMYNPDFAQLARGMGAKGLTLEKEEDLERVIREFLFDDPDVPTLLNAVCETDEHVFPMVPAGNGLHEMVLKRPETGPGSVRTSTADSCTPAKR